MKMNAVVVVLLAFVGGAGAFFWRALRTEDGSAVHELELRWLGREFALNDDVLLRIADLHRRYLADCEPMCEAFRASQAQIRRLISTNRGVTPQVTAALTRSNNIVVECQHRMLEHFYTVAGEMPAAAGRRYLDLMTPIVAHPGQGWMKMAP